MGVATIVVALCLRAEPAACRIYRWSTSGFIACAVTDVEPEIAPGWYRARRTCRWRGS